MDNIATELLLLLIGAIVGGGIGYFLGIHQDRENVRFEQGTAAVEHLRIEGIQISFSLRHLASRCKELAESGSYRDEEKSKARELNEKAWEYNERMNQLIGYYHAKKPWLNQEVREAFEQLTISGLSSRFITLGAEMQFLAEYSDNHDHKLVQQQISNAVKQEVEWANGTEPYDRPAIHHFFDQTTENFIKGSSSWVRKTRKRKKSRY